MINIGLPSGGEMLLLFVYFAVVYLVIRDLGAIGNESWGEAITLSSSGEKLIVGSSSTANDNRAVLWHPDR